MHGVFIIFIVFSILFEARDLELRHLGDLAAGASSEEDARAWADELGLSSRVSKSRFVRSWMEAREGLKATTPAKMGHVAPEAKYVEEVIKEAPQGRAFRRFGGCSLVFTQIFRVLAWFCLDFLVFLRFQAFHHHLIMFF